MYAPIYILSTRMYVRTYVCMYVRTYACMYVCMYEYSIYSYACVNVFIRELSVTLNYTYPMIRKVMPFLNHYLLGK